MSVAEVSTKSQEHAPRYTASWFLKRLVLGTLILAVSLGSLAWLTHAAIDDSATGESLIDTISRLASNF